MDDDRLPKQIKAIPPEPDLKAGYVPPRPPVSPIAKIKPTSPPPVKKGGETKGK